MRKALVVGIDHYDHSNRLYGCVNDARWVASMLKKNGDESRNFRVTELLGEAPRKGISFRMLKDNIEDLFKGDVDVALFYFAGHGHIDATGGYLVPSNAAHGDEGVKLDDVLTFANNSKARHKVIVLDSCHSGIAGTPPNAAPVAVLAEGMTILTASTKDQYATEQNGEGLFTRLFLHALSGAAANLVGQITPGSIYALVDQSLGAWEKQRPVFKSNVQSFVSLRNVKPAISQVDLKRIAELFPVPDYFYPLDPGYEPELMGRSPDMPPPDPVKVEKFAVLQKFNRVSLLVPVNAPHMWHAAMESTGCKLTLLGEHYRRLVEQDQIF